ncbi:hypothetical protein ACVILE_002085 [Streptomyces sp. M18.1]
MSAAFMPEVPHASRGPQGVVQPDVAARVELLRHRHAVVRQEDDPVPHPRVVREPHQLLHQPLAAVVRGVRLARDDDLDGPLGVQQQVHQPVAVAQHQRQALVRGNAPREADGEHVGVEDAVDPAQLGGPGAALPPGDAQAFAHLLDQLLAQGAAQLPDVLVGDVGDRVPAVRAADGQRVLGPLHADLPGAEPEHLGRDPGRGVHAVGDGGDRHLVGVEAGPQSGEHLPADPAVQQGDAVGALGQPEAHHGHVEQVGLAAGIGLHAEAQNRVDVQAREFGVGAEVPGDQLPVEAVDAGRDRGVGGEDGPGPDRLQRGGELQPLVAQFGDALQPEEARVALVGVEHLRRGVAGEPAVRAHRPDTSYAEQHLLEEPVLAAASVEPVGDPAFAEVVLLDVRVEQQQRHPADLGQPDPGAQLPAAGQGQGDVGGGAVGLLQEGQRQLVGVEDGVVLLLPAVPGEGLAEVAVPVEQADADERHAQVAGGLEVVAGQDAEAAGVLGQGGGDAELGREVGDGGGQSAGVGLVPAVAGHVVVEVVGHRGEPAQEAPVLGQLREAGRRHGAEQPYGVAARLGPARWVDGLEEVAGLRVPGPAQIAGQITERPEGVGEYGTDGQSTDRLHPSDVTGVMCPSLGASPEDLRFGLNGIAPVRRTG